MRYSLDLAAPRAVRKLTLFVSSAWQRWTRRNARIFVVSLKEGGTMQSGVSAAVTEHVV